MNRQQARQQCKYSRNSRPTIKCVVSEKWLSMGANLQKFNPKCVKLWWFTHRLCLSARAPKAIAYGSIVGMCVCLLQLLFSQEHPALFQPYVRTLHHMHSLCLSVVDSWNSCTFRPYYQSTLSSFFHIRLKKYFLSYNKIKRNFSIVCCFVVCSCSYLITSRTAFKITLASLSVPVLHFAWQQNVKEKYQFIAVCICRFPTWWWPHTGCASSLYNTQP